MMIHVIGVNGKPGKFRLVLDEEALNHDARRMPQFLCEFANLSHRDEATLSPVTRLAPLR